MKKSKHSKSLSPWDLTVKGSYDVPPIEAHSYPVNITEDKDYGFGKEYWDWGTDNIKSYDEWSWEKNTPPIVGVYNTQHYDAEEISAKWSGALVKFTTHLYARGLNLYDTPSLSVSMNQQQSGKDQPLAAGHLNHTGTVFEVDSKPNYRGQWCVNVLWSDGMVSYENILDLELIQPGT